MPIEGHNIYKGQHFAFGYLLKSQLPRLTQIMIVFNQIGNKFKVHSAQLKPLL